MSQEQLSQWEARLADKKVFVTGGSRGIGRAICTLFARQGADIAFNYHSNEQAARAVQEEVEALGRRCETYAGSVADVGVVKPMFRDAAAALGGLDVLVNNAGTKQDGLAMMMSEQAWSGVLDTNLKGTFYCCREAAKLMLRKKSGVIVNMTSLSGVMGQPGQVNYAASKGGVIALTKSLAKELADYGVRVNGIAPGFVETDMLDDVPESVLETSRATVPMKRFGHADEVARVALFLASDLASYVTGEVINVNGGLYM